MSDATTCKSTTRTIFFDESGFTGYNLLDPEQPIFSISSTDISDKHAKDILNESFPRYQGKEYHFTNIWTSHNRNGLKQFCNHLNKINNSLFSYAIDKRFAILNKIMEYLVEPKLTYDGYDFYSDGYCWKYSNFIHYGLTEKVSPKILDSLLDFYLKFSRDPTPDTLAIFQHQLHKMYLNIEQSKKALLTLIMTGAKEFEKYNTLTNFRKSNNLQTSVMIAIIAQWRMKYPEDFIVIHDTSSIFLRDREMWNAITGEKNPEIEIKTGASDLVKFPLRVISTKEIDSKKSYSVQFCDILAGLVTKHYNSKLPDDDKLFMNGLIDEGLGKIHCASMIPGYEFPDHIPPKKRQGPDTLDKISKIFSIHGIET